MNVYKYDEIEIGHKESFTVVVKQDDQDKFREITKDMNPLHADSSFAKAQGYDRCVVFGMLTASYLSTLAGVYLPGEKSLIHSVETKFTNPVYIGDTLTIEGTVKEKNDTFHLIILKVIITNESGKKVCKANMQIQVLS